MEKFTTVKSSVFAVATVIGGTMSYFLGGWDMLLKVLVLLQGVDWLLGTGISAILHKSKKSEDGRLNSSAGWRGLFKKGITLVIVLVATQVGVVIGSDVIRDGVVMAYITIEVVSILELGELAGVPIPQVLRNAISSMQEEGNVEND